jgi:membrane protease YdiL (CAAX protease family)
LLAAAFVSAALGREGLRTWGRRLAALRTNPVWYLVALLAPIALMAIVMLTNSFFGAPLPTGAQLGRWPTLGGELLGMFIAVGIGEEAGWTAFATPRLLARHRFITTFVLIAVLRVFWHLPLLLSGNLPVMTGVVANAGFQLMVLWAYYRSGGVWLLAAIWHAVHNVTSQFLSPMVDGADRIRIGPILAAVYWLAAGLVFVLDRRHLDAAVPQAAGPSGREVA